MKKFFILFALPLFTLAFCGVFFGAAARAEEYNFQSQWVAAHPGNKMVLMPWCEEINKAAAGEFTLNFFPGNALVKGEFLAAALKKGSVEAGGVQMQTAADNYPLSQLLGLPYLVRNAEEAEALYNAMYEKFPELRAELDKDFHVLALMGSDRFCLASMDSLVKTPEDIKGKRVLVLGNAQAGDVLAWGGIPIVVSSPELYLYFKRGLGDVAYVPVMAARVSQLHEFARYYTVMNARTLPMMIGMNKADWEKLSPRVQKCVNECSGRALSRRIAAQLTQSLKDDLEFFKAQNATVHMPGPEEEKIFKQLVSQHTKPYWVGNLKRNGVGNPEEWIKKVEDLAHSQRKQ